jgi:hypothetical protein
MMVTEFQWQYVERDDLQRSIYIIDLDRIRLQDFAVRFNVALGCCALMPRFQVEH